MLRDMGYPQYPLYLLSIFVETFQNSPKDQNVLSSCFFIIPKTTFHSNFWTLAGEDMAQCDG